MENKKLSVATHTRDFHRKTSQISQCLKGYPEGLNPKSIASKTRLNVNTVKSLLPKMSNIIKVMRGIYKVDNRGDSPLNIKINLDDWNFHNLVLSAPNASPRFVTSFSHGLVHFDVVVSKVGRATCRVSTDFPLNVSVISLVASLFADVVGVSVSSVMVSTIEFNRDYRNLRLDGVRSVSVDNLVEQFKVYQKQRGMRIEHKTKVPIGVETIVDMLSNNPNSVEFHLKLNKQEELLKRLALATNTTTRLLLKLHDMVGVLQNG